MGVANILAHSVKVRVPGDYVFCDAIAMLLFTLLVQDVQSFQP